MQNLSSLVQGPTALDFYM